jgi:hypothetical protein
MHFNDFGSTTPTILLTMSAVTPKIGMFFFRIGKSTTLRN